MHLAITKAFFGSRAIRLYVGSNKTEREYDLRVGIDFTATPTEMEEIRQRFRRTAWMLYGLTGGTVIIRSYQFFNSTDCDGLPLTACNGNCSVCMRYSPGTTANCNGLDGRVWVYLHNNEYSLTHEFGHCFTRNGGVDYVRDEYDPNGNRSCAHTWMAQKDNNTMTLCTDETHGHTGSNQVLHRTQAWVNQTATASWGYYYSAGLGGGGGVGGIGGGFPTQDSGWRWMNGRIPAAYPAYQTPEVLWMERFWTSPFIGRFDRLQ